MFAEKLKENRLRLNLTQEMLADMLSVTKATVSKWETSQSYPDLDTLPKLADIFSVSTDELLDYHPDGQKAEVSPTYTVTLCETFLRYRDVYNSDRYNKIRSVNYVRSFDENQNEFAEFHVNLDFRNPDVYAEIQKKMDDDEYIDSVETHADGKNYHIWITKDELLRFQTGNRAEIKAATKRLIEKGIITEDDLY